MTTKIMEKIRSLLAHGETPKISQEEAESYIKKAQELMTKYAIDELLVKGVSSDKITTVEFFMPSPYANAKTMSFGWIARVYNCRVVNSAGIRSKDGKKGMYGWVTGYEHDLEQLNVMFTSLLIQCTNAAMKNKDPYENTKSWRHNFIMGFFLHIKRVLEDQRQTSIKESDSSSDLLPVLADRQRLVEDALHERWPKLYSSTTNLTNNAGYSAGRSAAANADLNNPRISSRKALGR